MEYGYLARVFLGNHLFHWGQGSEPPSSSAYLRGEKGIVRGSLTVLSKVGPIVLIFLPVQMKAVAA